GIFCFALVLFVITCFFSKRFFSLFDNQAIGIEHMFESTIAITLALAIFDLAKTLIEQEVLGRTKKEEGGIQ
ncbi:hypothetical protein OLV99_08525, partial [Campylobacter jejuni]|nr:hypothetical protein [Campylobacter jejuni]